MTKRISIFVIALSVFLFMILSHCVPAEAETLAVLDFYVLERFPLGTLEGDVVPIGDDIFAAERIGLKRTLRRMVHGMVKENTDYLVIKMKDPAFLGQDVENVFHYYSNSENPMDYFDAGILAAVAEELKVDYVLVGLVESFEFTGGDSTDEAVKLVVSFLVYDANNEEYSFIEKYEESSGNVSGYSDGDLLPRIQGRVPKDIEVFTTSELGRVFLSIAGDFLEDFTGSSESAYLSETYDVDAYVDSDDDTGGHVPSGEVGTGRVTPPPPVTVGDAGSNEVAECIDRGQAIVMTLPSSRSGLRVYPCHGGYLNLSAPETETGRMVSSKKGLSGMSTGDFDGDGIDELVISTYEPGERVRLYKLENRVLNLDNVMYELLNVIPGDVGVYATAGDFDGDGTAELAVSSAIAFEYVMVLDFRDGRIVTENPLISFKNMFGSQGHGASVAAGDFDGDGRDELVMASAGGGEMVKVFSLPDGQRTRPRLLGDLRGFFGSQSYAVSVAAGDFDLDGKDELVLGTLDHGMKVKVVAFRDGKFDLDNPLADLRMEASGSNAGVRVFAGDFNGDRQDDLGISIIGGDGSFTVYQYRRGGFHLASAYLSSSELYRNASNGILVAVGKFE